MSEPLLINGEPHVLCQGCERMVPCHTHPTGLPDEGCEIQITGWYGGFTDTVFDDPSDWMLILCHDCSKRVFDAVPALAMLRGQHSTASDDVCCQYHWTFGHGEDGEITSVLYGDGTSRPIDSVGCTSRVRKKS